MTQPTIDKATFDGLHALGDAAFVQELVDTFLEEAPRLLKTLRQALTAGNADTFRRTAHSLKSNGKTFGAMTFAELARELEFLGRDNELGAVGTRLDKLEQEYARVATVLKRMRDG